MGMGRIGEVDAAHLAAGARDGVGRAERRGRRQRAHPALPGQAHDQPGARARHGPRPRLAEPGKIADVVLWRPGVLRRRSPQLGAQGRVPGVGAARVRAAASTRMCEPIVGGGLWGSLGGAPPRLATVFTAAGRSTALARAGPARSARSRDTRTVRKRDLVRNAATPDVVVDGRPRKRSGSTARRSALPPARELPLNRAYFLVSERWPWITGIPMRPRKLRLRPTVKYDTVRGTARLAQRAASRALCALPVQPEAVGADRRHWMRTVCRLHEEPVRTQGRKRDAMREIRRGRRRGPHYVFSPYPDPIASVDPGETMAMHTEDAFEGRITTEEDLAEQGAGLVSSTRRPGRSTWRAPSRATRSASRSSRSSPPATGPSARSCPTSAA